MRARAEDEIRMLCRKLLQAGDPIEVQSIAEQLQKALHEHIEDLRIQALSAIRKPRKGLIM